MKTILLTSTGTDVKEEFPKVIAKPANEVRLAHIITASKPEENKSYLEAEKKGGNPRIAMNVNESELQDNARVRDAEIGGDIADAMFKIYQAYSYLKNMDELITLALSGLGGLLGKILG